MSELRCDVRRGKLAAGDNHVFQFHRLFGDVDGDSNVDASDFALFRLAFGPNPSIAFDFDNDGDVDTSDFGQFRQRFGLSI